MIVSEKNKTNSEYINNITYDHTTIGKKHNVKLKQFYIPLRKLNPPGAPDPTK